MTLQQISREQQLQKLASGIFDAVIVGGGINGAASAACLSAHGYKVALIEQNDFASMTSQQSSNMIWGGIKYLENGEISLVNKLCLSRNRLIKNFPDNVQEIPYLLNLESTNKFSQAFYLCGAYCYWLMGRCKTQPPRFLSKSKLHTASPASSENFNCGIEYYDAILPENDSRFVFSFIRNIWENNNLAINYCKVFSTSHNDDGWDIKVRDNVTSREIEFRTKFLINAAGPRALIFNKNNYLPSTNKLIFSKGIHLIVPAITTVNKVLTFISDDKRLFFALPMGNRTCLGTTDTRVDVPHAKVNDEDRDFVLSNINKRLHLSKILTRKDIISERCGIRPLVVSGTDDHNSEWLTLSRKHIIEINEKLGLITLLGGKLTDCLNVGESVLSSINSMQEINQAVNKWFGEENNQQKKAFLSLADKFLDSDKALQLWRRYGSRAQFIMELISATPDKMLPAICEGSDLIWAEVHYMCQFEMPVFLEDILRRRSKTSLIVEKHILENSPSDELIKDLLANSCTAGEER